MRFTVCLLIVVVTVKINKCYGAIPSTKAYEVPDSCTKQVKNDCQPILIEKGQSDPTCFGVKLPYAETSNELINENYTQSQIKAELKRWEEGLKSLPRCWAVVQPLLCSYYLPKCQEKKIELPSQELCRISKNPCRVIEESMKEWPDFLKCDNTEKFVANCKNTEVIRELPFNTSATCNYPMISVQAKYYEGFDGCALKCKDHLFSDEEHDSVSRWIYYTGLACLISTGFVLITYIIDWRSSKQYPSVIIFWAVFGYMIATAGWLLQFLPNAKEDIVCRKDHTLRRQEPGSDENVFCFVVFSLIYFGSMSSLAWLVVFAYVWNLTCNAVGRIRDRIDKQSVYFHFVCWCIPLVLTIICGSLSAVDGNSLSGICYVTSADSTLRITLVIIPVAIAVAVMLLYSWRGIYRLISVSVSSSDYVSSQQRRTLKSRAFRMGLFSVFATVLLVAFLFGQSYELQWRTFWEKSRRDFLVCNLNLTTVAECDLSSKPTVPFIIWNNIIFFLGGLLVSTWAWTGASIQTWRRFVARRFKSENSLDHHAVPKHKLISQAFSKRHQLPAKGRLSLSLQSTHEDPIGLNRLLDPTHVGQGVDTEMQTQNNTDAESEDIHKSWAAALPNLVSRRGALVPPHSSNSVSCVSACDDSRRPSCDSAMSESTSRHYGTPYKERKRRFSRIGKRAKDRLSAKFFGGRRHAGSSTSLESNQGSQILPAITALIDKKIRNNRNDDDLFMPLNNAPTTAPVSRRPIIMKEFAVQTSLEKLASPHTYGTKGNLKNCNLSNNLTSDKATQSSLVSLHEIGTQTKKSATKKKDKSGKEKKTENGGKDKDDNLKDEEEDPVLKLLTPN